MHAIYSDTLNNTYTKMNLSTGKWAQWDKTQSWELLGLFICVCIAPCTIDTILHRTHLIIFPLTLQTITIAPMMSIWGKGEVLWAEYQQAAAALAGFICETAGARVGFWGRRLWHWMTTSVALLQRNLQPRPRFFQSGLNPGTKSNRGYQACKKSHPSGFDGFLTFLENLAYQSPDSFNDAVD